MASCWFLPNPVAVNLSCVIVQHVQLIPDSSYQKHNTREVLPQQDIMIPFKRLGYSTYLLSFQVLYNSLELSLQLLVFHSIKKSLNILINKGLNQVKLIVWYKNGESLFNKIEDKALSLMNVATELISGLGVFWYQALSLLIGVEWVGNAEDRSWEESWSHSLLCRLFEELTVG